MKTFFTALVSVLLVIAAVSNGQTTQSQPLTKEVVQGCYLNSITGVWIKLTNMPLDSCSYQIAIARASDLPSAIMVGADNAFHDIARMHKAMISIKAKEIWGGYGPDIVNQIERKAILMVDSVSVMLAHPLAYMILFTDSEGLMTIQVAVGWERRIGGTLEQAAINSLNLAAKAVLEEKSRALLNKVDDEM
jgi:hypothetical protein